MNRPLFFLLLGILILWGALLPGYVLLLDMPFAPGYRLVLSDSGLLNMLPVSATINFVAVTIPAWLIQKIIFLALFFCMGFVPFKFLPLIRNETARFFAAMVYVLNPFVYSRFLAGHWALLFGYAFLPMFIHCLFAFVSEPNFKNSLKTFAALFLINLFSIYVFAMGVMMVAITMVAVTVAKLQKTISKDYPLRVPKGNPWDSKLFFGALSGALVFIIASSYWIIPAFYRAQPLERSFNAGHWGAFAGGGYKNVPAWLNLLSLNGFWGERQLWARYFSWPQDHILFWLALAVLIALVLTGIFAGIKNKQSRAVTLFFFATAFFAFVFSAGAGGTVFKNFNIRLYENIPFWTSFRDSQKFIALLILSYAVLSGMGMEFVIKFFKNKKDIFAPLAFLVPVFLGFFMWGGFQRQIRPVWYPESWYEAKEIIGSDKVLVLPWHGYFSLKFNNNIVTANPSEGFFGRNIVVGRSVEIGELYDQEADAEYRELDVFIRGKKKLSDEDSIKLLKSKNITHIVFIQDLKETDNLKYDFLSAPGLQKIFASPEIEAYKVL